MILEVTSRAWQPYAAHIGPGAAVPRVRPDPNSLGGVQSLCQAGTCGLGSALEALNAYSIGNYILCEIFRHPRPSLRRPSLVLQMGFLHPKSDVAEGTASRTMSDLGLSFGSHSPQLFLPGCSPAPLRIEAAKRYFPTLGGTGKGTWFLTGGRLRKYAHSALRSSSVALLKLSQGMGGRMSRPLGWP